MRDKLVLHSLAMRTFLGRSRPLKVEYRKPGLVERFGSWLMRGGYDTPYRYGLPISYCSSPPQTLGEILRLQGEIDRYGFDSLLNPPRSGVFTKRPIRSQ